VTEERIGGVRLAMMHLGKVKPLDLGLTMLSSPELRELLSTWREAMNAATPMSQALGFYKIIERVHKCRVDREARTRDSDSRYLPPRELMPDNAEPDTRVRVGQRRVQSLSGQEVHSGVGPGPA
jgi:hypothetical protein